MYKKKISINKYYLSYLFLSLALYILIYRNTIGLGSLSLDDDYYGLLRGFPSDIGEYLSIFSQSTFDGYHRNIGPTALLYIFNLNLFLIFIIQFIIYQIFIYKLFKINKSLLFLALCLLPMLSLSTLFPNKELYTILFYASLILFSTYKKFIYIITSIIFIFFARPELIVILVLFIVINNNKYIFKYIFLFLILLISIFYEDFYRMDDYRLVLERGVSLENSIALLLDNLSREYSIYFLIFPLKIVASIIDGNFFNIIIFLLLLIYALKKFKINSIYILLVLTLLYGTIVSFPHFRYLLPTYIVLFHIAGLEMNSIKFPD